MQAMYNIVISCYYCLIKFAALFNAKASLWVSGRKKQQIPDLKDEKTIWMHCSSLGEYEQGKPVFDALRQQYKNYKYVISFFSPSGYEKMKDKDIADYILYLPIDLPHKASEFVNKINPSLSIFVKYDIWYNYLKLLNKSKSIVVFISVLFDSGHSIFKYYNKILLNELRKTDYIFTQDDNTKSLLEQRNFNNVLFAGDTRVDRVLAIAKEPYEDDKLKNFCQGNKKILICGSTWEKDIEKLSAISKMLLAEYKIVIAPHEISEHQINYIKNKFINTPIALYTKYENTDTEKKILIIDTIGILSKIYRYGDIAYIGGGFGHGIHNTLEPAAYKLPVIFGPKYKKFNEAKILVKNQSFFTYNNISQLEQIFISLKSEEFYNKAKSGIDSFLKSNQGASKKILETLESKLAIPD